MRKLFVLGMVSVTVLFIAGCGKPADKKPSWDGAPTTNTPPPVGKAGADAENLPKSKTETDGDRAPAGGAANPAAENLPGQAAPAAGGRQGE